MSDKLIFERDGHVATLTLNQPELRNPITDLDFVEAFVERCNDIQADMDIRCVIVTGAGAGFSSGGNLKHMRDRVGTFFGNAAEIAAKYRQGIQRIPLAMAALEVPVIAAVNGPAYGAGCDLAMMCDIRLASESAVFAENFVRVGIIPGDGGAWLLPRTIGMARAAEMTFTGDSIDAATALSWGLVSNVFPADGLMPAAWQLARRISINPPLQLRMAKRLLRESTHARLEDILELSAVLQGECHQTNDHKEAVAALLEKRPAIFMGS
ncbi:crotonase/enoyl-CoA hydratase family protein [Mesorhizobium sp. VK25A]|uniref:Crotonase/enoyl-CoA hydratase family protein n=1 Tax=Mesorhizobium vachelliae TaxID=3072309 RepID=A0ABU5AF39_9HYPH|nr:MULTISPECIES: crotonase/enoyl-CoA hydratase family protein [unclassified Mesorhizobium]MDX8535891.1 crotonase/enoyl-CoA hydratase family protein [Mesorhizobium sp. VK25D]MDX8548645.1 crotonase/enoyl-CoA hydratase family protein [Mesorhizobium sp. VK25A]